MIRVLMTYRRDMTFRMNRWIRVTMKLSSATATMIFPKGSYDDF